MSPGLCSIFIGNKMSVNLNIGNAEGTITGGSLTFSREGMFYLIIGKGDSTKVETTFTTDKTSNTIKFDKDWNTGLEVTFDANIGLDANYNDVWTKFQIDPNDVDLMKADESDLHGDASGDKGIEGYRELENRLVKRNAGGDGYDSGTGFWKDSTWKTLKALKGGMQANNQEKPYVKYSVTDQVAISSLKSKNVGATTIMRSFHRIISTSPDVASAATTTPLFTLGFVPFQVMIKDRFRYERAYNSFRDAPGDTTVTETVRDDQTDLDDYVQTKADKFAIQSVNGRVTLQGIQDFNLGETIGNIIIDSEGQPTAENFGLGGAAVKVQASVLSISHDYQNNRTTLELGRP